MSTVGRRCSLCCRQVDQRVINELRCCRSSPRDSVSQSPARRQNRRDPAAASFTRADVPAAARQRQAQSRTGEGDGSSQSNRGCSTSVSSACSCDCCIVRPVDRPTDGRFIRFESNRGWQTADAQEASTSLQPTPGTPTHAVLGCAWPC